MKDEEVAIDFIGIASLRCGTTWISRCLAEHPQICFTLRKEINFFGRNYTKGLEYYQSFFKHCTFCKDYNRKIKGEFTPAYYLYDKAPQRIKRHFPDVKLLACLRNPIERILSHHRSRIKRDPKTNPDISKELNLNYYNYYKTCGFYYRHLSRFLEYFNPKNLLILIYEDALDNPAEFIKSIYRFLEIDKNFIPKTLYNKGINITPKTGGIDKKTRENLRQLYKDDIKKLEKLLRRDLGFWK